jgi:hypothetical protein
MRKKFMPITARIIISLLLLFFSAGISLAAEEDLLVVDESGTTLVNDSALTVTIAPITVTTLSDQERDGLLYMVEEEKLAGDVYFRLYDQWNLPIFKNIGNAERTHEAAVKTLLQRYGLEDPTKEPGAFNEVALQELYDELVNRGTTSLEEALKVGAGIEELDILDLEEYIDQTDKQDIMIVYSNLMKGSENHLRAFVRQLNSMGSEYQPQYMSSEEYNEVV